MLLLLPRLPKLCSNMLAAVHTCQHQAPWYEPCTNSSGGRVLGAPPAAGRCSSSSAMPSGSTCRFSRTNLQVGAHTATSAVW